MKHPYPRPPQFALRVRRCQTGLGLFADENIPAGRFVIEYWGRLVPDPEAWAIGGKYLYELGNGKTILGAERKNTARYANHSCDPNCESRTVGNRAFIFSVRPIAKGEPITYDYGPEYFDAYIGKEGCQCGGCLKEKGGGKRTT